MSEGGSEQLRRLVEENARLAEKLEASEGARDGLARGLAELREELELLQGQLREAAEAIAATEGRTRALQQERDRLQESMALASSRLYEEGRPPVLSAAEVSSLVDRLLKNLGSQLSGMSVQEGELTLNVAFEKVGDQTGFVLPTVDSPPQSREGLHTISVRLTSEAE